MKRKNRFRVAVVAGCLILALLPVNARAAESGKRGTEIPLPEYQAYQEYQTGIPGITLQETGELCYEVSHQGPGLGQMGVSGNAAGDYELAAEIVKTGVLGEAEYRLSLDGGKTFIGQDVAGEACRIEDVGLTLHFFTEQDSTEFIQGDVYRASIPETFPVSASEIGEANVVAMGHPLEDHELTVEILSSGGLGVSRFAVSTPEERILADVVPEDGVYELSDHLQMVFSDSAGYERGMSYHVTVKSNDGSVSYLPLVLLVLTMVSAIFMVLWKLAGKREKPGEYRLHVYKGMKEKYD